MFWVLEIISRAHYSIGDELRTVPTEIEVFCVVYKYVGKADLSKGYWNPKRKLGVTSHVLEIIKQNV